MALIAACVLVPADYFAINSLPAVFAKLGMNTCIWAIFPGRSWGNHSGPAAARCLCRRHG